MLDEAIDLSRLNAVERAMLKLLAQGHTAKSIATITGHSVGAVNERLREARRKTGMGSSRELARIVAAQENRDDFIGVALPLPAAAPIDRAEATPAWRARPWIGVIVMSLIGVLALGAATMSWWNGQSPPTAPQPAELHAALIAETRDTAWADQAERRLDAIYAPIRSVGPITVSCRRTLCEVTGEIAPGDAAAAVETLQSGAINDRVRSAGFADQPVISFSIDGKQSPRFITFWRTAR